MRLVAWLGVALLGAIPVAVAPATAAPPDAAPSHAAGSEPSEPDAMSGDSDGDDEAAPGDDEAEAESRPRPAKATAGPTAVDAVLACGLRLVAAEDDTLPVAAVVLAVETGTEDDPADQPGLVHALAFQLLQGNRDLAPGGVTEMVDDGGGVASLAIGPAQVRFESLLPTSLLDDVLWAETHRLRAPTVTPRLWAETLSWARRDAPHPSTLAPDVLAAVHDVPGLGHEGRHTSPALEAMTEREVAAALVDWFGYDRATLVVVAPQPPEATLAAVQGLLADLPPHARRIPARATVPSPAADEPRTLPRVDADGRTFAWPVDPDPAAVTWARILVPHPQRPAPGRHRAPQEPDPVPGRPRPPTRDPGAEGAGTGGSPAPAPSPLATDCRWRRRPSARAAPPGPDRLCALRPAPPPRAGPAARRFPPRSRRRQRPPPSRRPHRPRRHRSRLAPTLAPRARARPRTRAAARALPRESMTPRSRHVPRLLLAAVLLPTGAFGLAGGCKRQRAPKVAEVWDDDPTPERAEAIANLSPPWPAPIRAVLDDGLLAYWLEEAGSPAVHIRLLLPTTSADRPASAETVAVTEEYLRQLLERRLAGAGMGVSIDHAPGRVELSLHGRGEQTALALRWLGWALGHAEPAEGLLHARDRVAGRIGVPTSRDVATAMLTAGLLGLPADSERVDPTRLRALSREHLVEGFRMLTDPRAAVLVVHTGGLVEEARVDLRHLADAWRARGRRRVRATSTARLRAAAPPRRTGRLLADPPSPLQVSSAPTQGGPVLVLGRVIPTPTSAERALARLAQRVIQEEVDARISIAGDHAVFVVEVPLSAVDPDCSAQQAIDALGELAAIRHQRQRLFQAAQLWLGARVVQASLDGEDWTGLWSQAIDLADDEADVGGALARDAQAMLDADPEALQAWQKRWLDPRRGEAGWAWTVAGAIPRWWLACHEPAWWATRLADAPPCRWRGRMPC